MGARNGQLGYVRLLGGEQHTRCHCGCSRLDGEQLRLYALGCPGGDCRLWGSDVGLPAGSGGDCRLWGSGLGLPAGSGGDCGSAVGQ